MSDWDIVANDLLRKACFVDADVQLRSLALQQQCAKLQAICQYIYDVETGLTEEKSAQTTENLAVEQSIQDAIQRARQVRAELATKDHDSDKDSDEEQSKSLDAEEQKLQSILAVAKATRTAQQSLETVEHKMEAIPRVRLEYPRKLRALETQLEELRLKDKESSMRFAFCCKMSEHLSLSPKRRQVMVEQQQKFGSGSRMDMSVARIQTSFPMQVDRLRGGYQLLVDFVMEKIEVGSPKFQQAVDASTLSAVFPIYHRLKQAKKMLRLLNGEARALLDRLPTSPPKLSSATEAHRDAMLARIRRKKPQADVGVIENEALQVAAQKTSSPLHVDEELLEKLQAAWLARSSSTTNEGTPARNCIDVYSTTVREIILTDLSNVVLWSFKMYFADTAEQPDASQVEAVMRLVRLVDSVALSQGRTYRSVCE